jgi:Protein of unknown function (DUF3467)
MSVDSDLNSPINSIQARIIDMADKHGSEKHKGQASETPSAHVGAPAQTQTEIRLDTSKMTVNYANFCRVTGTPEELIVDFGLNAEPIGAPVEALTINHRLVLNFYTAKRFAEVLIVTLQRHEATFGVLETDVQKRVIAQPGQ